MGFDNFETHFRLLVPWRLKNYLNFWKTLARVHFGDAKYSIMFLKGAKILREKI